MPASTVLLGRVAHFLLRYLLCTIWWLTAETSRAEKTVILNRYMQSTTAAWQTGTVSSRQAACMLSHTSPMQQIGPVCQDMYLLAKGDRRSHCRMQQPADSPLAHAVCCLLQHPPCSVRSGRTQPKWTLRSHGPSPCQYCNQLHHTGGLQQCRDACPLAAALDAPPPRHAVHAVHPGGPTATRHLLCNPTSHTPHRCVRLTPAPTTWTASW
jgi:hypothetical protein